MPPKIHIRPLVGPDRTEPVLLLTADVFGTEPWLRRMSLRKEDRLDIDHGWVLAPLAGVRVRAATIASGYEVCEYCSNGLWCGWAMKHAGSLESLPYAIPFTRNDRTSYYASDEALLALGLRDATLADAARSVGKQLLDAAKRVAQDPAWQQRIEAEVRGAAQQYFSQAFNGSVRDDVADAEQVLGIAGAYSLDDIRAAKRRMALKHHPDRGGDPETMARINAAADLLSARARSEGAT
jgi:hypothetical protein